MPGLRGRVSFGGLWPAGLLGLGGCALPGLWCLLDWGFPPFPVSTFPPQVGVLPFALAVRVYRSRGGWPLRLLRWLSSHPPQARALPWLHLLAAYVMVGRLPFPSGPFRGQLDPVVPGLIVGRIGWLLGPCIVSVSQLGDRAALWRQKTVAEAPRWQGPTRF